MDVHGQTTREALEIITIDDGGGVIWSTEMGYVIAFALFIVMMFARRQ